jgi:hypothetical protein
MIKYENLKIIKNKNSNEYILMLKLGEFIEKRYKIQFLGDKPTNSDIKRTLKRVVNDINFNLIDTLEVFDYE